MFEGDRATVKDNAQGGGENVLILGAGLVAAPAVEYLARKPGRTVTVSGMIVPYIPVFVYKNTCMIDHTSTVLECLYILYSHLSKTPVLVYKNTVFATYNPVLV